MEMLEFIYSDKIENVQNSHIVPLFLASNQYAIVDLQKWCQKKFESILTIDNVMDYYEIVVKSNAFQLKPSLLKFISNFNDVMGQKKFLEIEKDDMVEIFKLLAQNK